MSERRWRVTGLDAGDCRRPIGVNERYEWDSESEAEEIREAVTDHPDLAWREVRVEWTDGWSDAPTPARGDVEALGRATKILERSLAWSREHKEVPVRPVFSQREVAALLAALAPETTAIGWTNAKQVGKWRDEAEERGLGLLRVSSGGSLHPLPVYIGTPLTPESDDDE